MWIAKIVSGGQTGVDRAALDVAISQGIEHGGWAPQGRLAEDGPIASKYRLKESQSSDPAQRTEWNVRDSDATLILSSLPLGGGTALTQHLAIRDERPLLVINLDLHSIASAVDSVLGWLDCTDGNVLNVAGPRGSEQPQAYNLTYEILRKVLDQRSAKSAGNATRITEMSSDDAKMAWEIHKDADSQLHSRLGFFAASQSFLVAAYLANKFADKQSTVIANLIIILGLSLVVVFFVSCMRLIRGIEYLKDTYLIPDTNGVYAKYLEAARGRPQSSLTPPGSEWYRYSLPLRFIVIMGIYWLLLLVLL
jgi:hypothetical protein